MLRLTVLGSGGPTPTPDRFGSSYVLQLGDERIMVDCGPATTHKLVKAGLWPTDIDYLFFTHHHFDHDVDYPCFLLTRWDQDIGQASQLQVFGPAPTQKLTHDLISEEGAFAHDWKARINAPLSHLVFTRRGGVLPRKPPDPAVRDVGPGRVHSGKDWEITAAPAEHVEPWLDSLAYRLDSPEGSIVFTGDTQPCQSVIDLSQGADVMVCMCNDLQEVMGCSGPQDAAEMAQQAGVKKLVMVHIGKALSGHGPMEEGIGLVKKTFDGQVFFTEELMTLDL
jgi:ribonuclease BN (tRNA processing enzyme)